MMISTDIWMAQRASASSMRPEPSQSPPAPAVGWLAPTAPCPTASAEAPTELDVVVVLGRAGLVTAGVVTGVVVVVGTVVVVGRVVVGRVVVATVVVVGRTASRRSRRDRSEQEVKGCRLTGDHIRRSRRGAKARRRSGRNGEPAGTLVNAYAPSTADVEQASSDPMTRPHRTNALWT